MPSANSTLKNRLGFADIVLLNEVVGFFPAEKISNGLKFLLRTSKIRLYSSDKGSGGSNYFFINSLDEKSTKMRKGIGFGGNNFK